VVENQGEEAEEDESYEGSVEDDGSFVTDASRSVNGSRFDESVDASANASRAGGDSYEAELMELVEDNAREATNEFEGVVPEVEEEGHDNTPALAEKADEDVEIHSLLLDEASVAPAATVTTTTRTRDRMQEMVIEEELAVVEIIQTHDAYEESDSGDEIEEKEEEMKVVEEKSVDKSAEQSVEEEEKEEEVVEEEYEQEKEEEEEEVPQSYIDAMDKRLRALTKNELAAKLKPRGERTYGLKEELVVRLRNALLLEEKAARQQQRSAGGGDKAEAQRAQAVATSNGTEPATPSRKRGRPTKAPVEVIEVPDDDDEEEQVVAAAPEPVKKAAVAPPRKVAKRRKAGLASEPKQTQKVEEEEEQKVVADNVTVSSSEETAPAAVEYSQSMWPSLAPKTLPRAYEPLCGWDALFAGGNPQLLPFSLPDPDEVRRWDIENDESLRNQVALLRLWVLSQPINLETYVSSSSYSASSTHDSRRTHTHTTHDTTANTASPIRRSSKRWRTGRGPRRKRPRRSSRRGTSPSVSAQARAHDVAWCDDVSAYADDLSPSGCSTATASGCTA
jgi:hypothetical protein